MNVSRQEQLHNLQRLFGTDDCDTMNMLFTQLVNAQTQGKDKAMQASSLMPIIKAIDP